MSCGRETGFTGNSSGEAVAITTPAQHSHLSFGLHAHTVKTCLAEMIVPGATIARDNAWNPV